jgi:DNA polymerase-1
MSFDKAKCDQCPLKTHWEKEGCWSPVDFETNTEPGGVVLLGDAPSKSDMDGGRPHSDMAGAYILEELKELGISRKDVSWGNILGCRWPNDDPKTYLASLRSANRKRKAKGKRPFMSPIEACLGHRLDRLKHFGTILTMGSIAAKAVYGGNPKLDSIRGGPALVGGQKVLPTYAPTTVQKQPKFRSVFASDLAKLFRYHEDALRWVDPEVHYNPTVRFAEAFFDEVRQAKYILAYDVETDGVDCLSADLRCIGIGTTDVVLIFGFLSIDGLTRLYGPEEEREVKDLLRKVFTDPTILKSGHNAGMFDRCVIEEHLGVTPVPLVDTILLHKLAASEHRHGLGFVGSLLTDVPAWKADHSAVEARTDHELHSYCATDVAVTARIVEPLKVYARRREQLRLYPFDAKLQGLCVGMRRMGLRVDEGRRREHEREQREESDKWKAVIHEMAPSLEPNSGAQVRDLLFDKWALPPQKYTEGGDFSVDADVLRALVASPLVDDEQRKFINALRFYRRAEKLQNTYLRKMAPGSPAMSGEYLHSDWNVHGTVTGRLSSSGPNQQNIPYSIRDMFIPPPGCVFVGADYDQLELRFAAGLAGAPMYIDAFEARQIDPHNLTGELMFGDKFWEAEGAPDTKMGKGTGQFKKMRNLAKTICFASLYGASAPKIHDLVSRTEDNDGNLLYAHYNIRHIRTLHRRWKERGPEFAKWWAKTLQECRNRGYVEEVVLGRRRFFHMEDYNAILNFGVQAGGFAVVAKAMLELVEGPLPFDFNQKHGLQNQLHDAVLFAVPEAKAEEARDIITETLTTRVDGLPVEFTAEAEIGNDWSKV